MSGAPHLHDGDQEQQLLRGGAKTISLSKFGEETSWPAGSLYWRRAADGGDGYMTRRLRID